MKKKNIINLLYGIINSVIQGEEKCIDIQIYEVKQCFVSVSISVYQYLHKHTNRDEKDWISYPWQENLFCPDLKVHGTKMGQVNEDLPRGHSEQLLKNIRKRVGKGLGIISQIISILETVSFGMYYFEIAMTLREFMFVNGILTNSDIL